MDTVNIIGTIIAILVGLSGLILALVQYRRQKGREESGDLAELIKRIAALETSHAQIDVKVSLFWKAFEGAAIKMIHCPNTPEIDDLLDRYYARTISDEEIFELRNRLEEMVREDGEKKNGAILLLSMMELRELFT